MRPTDFIARLRKGQWGTAYFFRGPDRLMHEESRAALLNSVPAEARAWCLTEIEFESGSLERALQAAHQIPMLGSRNVLFISDSEDFKRAADRDVEALEAYFTKPSAFSTVVFAAVRPDRRRRFIQLLEKKAEIVEMSPLAQTEAAAWAQEYFHRAGFELERNLAEELAAKFEIAAEGGGTAARLGVNALWMRTEMEKLLTARAGRQRLTREDMELIAAFREEHEIGRMLQAVAERKLGSALQYLHELLTGKTPEMLMIWSLAELVREALRGNTVARSRGGWGPRGNPLAIAAIAAVARQRYSREELLHALRLVRNADLSIKSSWKDSKLLLEFLLWQMIAGKAAEGGPLSVDVAAPMQDA